MKNNCIIILYPAYFLSFSISLCSLKIILFLLIGCSLGCSNHSSFNRDNVKTNVYNCYPEIINKELKESIIQYVNDRVLEFQAYNFTNFKDIKLLTITFNINNNGNKIYTIRESGLGWIFDDPRPIFIGSIGDIYFGFYNQDNHDFQMSIESMINVLGKDYPYFKTDYEEYQKRLKKFPKEIGYALAAFESFIYEGDYWILEFSGNKLVSKTIVMEMNGTKQEFRYD